MQTPNDLHYDTWEHILNSVTDRKDRDSLRVTCCSLHERIEKRFSRDETSLKCQRCGYRSSKTIDNTKGYFVWGLPPRHFPRTPFLLCRCTEKRRVCYWCDMADYWRTKNDPTWHFMAAGWPFRIKTAAYGLFYIPLFFMGVALGLPLVWMQKLVLPYMKMVLNDGCQIILSIILFFMCCFLLAALWIWMMADLFHPYRRTKAVSDESENNHKGEN